MASGKNMDQTGQHGLGKAVPGETTAAGVGTGSQGQSFRRVWKSLGGEAALKAVGAGFN